jgi:hypothetical protein
LIATGSPFPGPVSPGRSRLPTAEGWNLTQAKRELLTPSAQSRNGEWQSLRERASPKGEQWLPWNRLGHLTRSCVVLQRHPIGASPMFELAGSVSAQVILAATFGAAAVGKLLAGGARSAELEALGVPVWVADRVRWALPGAELTTAVLLAWQPTVRLGAVGAAVLLVLFTGVLVATLASGRRPSCSCFGVAQRTVGAASLARNAALIGVAAVVLAAPPQLPTGAVRWLVIAATVILVQAWLLRLTVSRPSAEGSPPVPGHRSPTAHPGGISEARAAPGALVKALQSPALAGRPTVAVFVDPNCGPCQLLLSGIAGWHPALDDAAVALVSRGPLPDEGALARDVDAILHDPMGALAAEMDVPGTPAALLLDETGRPLDRPKLGLDAVRELLGQRGDARAPVTEAAPVEPLPLIADPDPPVPSILGLAVGSGQPVPTADPAGRWTVVLLSARRCADCAAVVAAARRRHLEPTYRVVVLDARDAGVPGADLTVDDHRAFAGAVGLDDAPAVIVLDGAGLPLAAPAIGAASTLATLDALVR